MADLKGVEFDPFADYLRLDELLGRNGCRRLRGKSFSQNGPGDSRGSPTSEMSDLGENFPLTADEDGALPLVIVRNNSPVQSRNAGCGAILSPVEEELHELVELMRAMVFQRQCPSPPQNFPPALQRPGAYCAFCRQNGEMRRFYTSHGLKDRLGNVTCPVLRAYVCPLCRATGDQAHTLKYCPLAESSESVPLAKALRTGRNCTGQRRFTKQ